MPSTKENMLPTAEIAVGERRAGRRSARARCSTRAEERRPPTAPRRSRRQTAVLVRRTIRSAAPPPAHIPARRESPPCSTSPYQSKCSSSVQIGLVEVDQQPGRKRDDDAGDDVDEEQPVPRQGVGAESPPTVGPMVGPSVAMRPINGVTMAWRERGKDRAKRRRRPSGSCRRR